MSPLTTIRCRVCGTLVEETVMDDGRLYACQCGSTCGWLGTDGTGHFTIMMNHGSFRVIVR